MVMIIFFINNYQFYYSVLFLLRITGHASGGEGSELATAKIFVCHPRVGLGRRPRYSLFMENGSPLSPSVAAKPAVVAGGGGGGGSGKLRGQQPAFGATAGAGAVEHESPSQRGSIEEVLEYYHTLNDAPSYIVDGLKERIAERQDGGARATKAAKTH